MQVHKRKGHLKLPCSLNRQGKNYECHPAYWFQFISILGGYTRLFSLINHAYYVLRLINVSATVTW